MRNHFLPSRPSLRSHVKHANAKVQCCDTEEAEKYTIDKFEWAFQMHAV